MNTHTSINLAISFRDVHLDFMVSREAIGISKRTYQTYEASLEKFYKWLEGQGIYSCNDAFTTRNINAFLAYLRGLTTRTGKPLSDRYIHIFARLSALNGLDTIWIQFLMGHENIQTTVDYIQELDVSNAEKFYQEHAPLRDIKR
jgi:site-specific recombinase XerD